MSARNSLRGRVPGQLVMSEIMTAQNAQPERSLLQRVFGVSPLTTRTRPLYRAALAELLVGTVLDNLGPEWDVLHVVPVDDSAHEIDHLVIGPAGIFCFVTRNFAEQKVEVYHDSLLVGGARRNDMAVARELAANATSLLSAAIARPITVHPVLVLVDPAKLVVQEQPFRLTVVSSRNVVRWLTRHERTLVGTEVAFVSDMADRIDTWRSTAYAHDDDQDAEQDTEQLNREFATLRESVRSAVRVSVGWWIAACILISSGAGIATATLMNSVIAR
jgi:hypothetical protein